MIRRIPENGAFPSPLYSINVVGEWPSVQGDRPSSKDGNKYVIISKTYTYTLSKS
jgi:hypothetical protein